MKKFCCFIILYCFSVFSINIDSDSTIFFEDEIHYINGCVNALKGNFNLSFNDFEIKGFEPLSFKRFYSTAKVCNYDGGWNFLPHKELTVFF